ncbi:hypothetical protein HDU88_003217 [Geranomyces variabilis]|nr:hypothetical protein HDU88_003217 [Geranomyces variabilis]
MAPRPILRLLAALAVFVPAVYILSRIYAPSVTTPSPLTNNLPCYTVEGFSTCPYFQNAAALARSLPDHAVAKATVNAHSRAAWPARRDVLQSQIPGAASHRSSPFVWAGCDGEDVEFVGGYDQFSALVDAKGWRGGQ